MIVHEVMTSPAVTVPTGTSLKHAVALLARHGVTSLPVVDDDGRVCGVVSEADLVRESAAADRRLSSPDPLPEGASWATVVDDVMTPHAVVVHPDLDLAHAVDLLTTTEIKSVPVVDEHRRVVGMVSRSDVVRLLARADDDIRLEVARTLADLGHDDWLLDVDDGHVDVQGPTTSGERRLAEVAAAGVPGVVDVHVR